MRCGRCGADNPDGKRFCGDCGAAFALCCPQCGAENPYDKKFCGDCGASLIQQPVAAEGAEASALVEATQSIGERRHLTVLFCDLVDSTALASQLDPEDWRSAVGAYHRTAAEAITRFGGHVAKYLGDGVMAFFGYPEAHDNDAERAARSGLALLDALAVLNESSAHPRLAARIGIDSGPVVVGAGAGPGADVFGDVPNVAARVQSAAESDSVFVTAATHRLISGLFITEDRGTQTLKGIAEPLPLYRIVRPSGARGRLEAAAAARGLTPFVGRDDELRLLTSRWERAREGEGQVALIIGEAGIGKSRLLHRFRETLSGAPHSWIDAAAGAFFQHTPFYPVTEILRQLVWVQSFNRLDDYLRDPTITSKRDSEPTPTPVSTVPDEAIAQLLTGLTQAGISPAVAIPLLAPLLNLALPPEYAPSTLPPDQQRRRLLATLVAWILATARTQPLIIAIEDLHWADPSTLELIQLLVEQGNTVPLFLLFTARPEFRSPWPLRSHHAQINLNRLNVRDVRTIVAQIAAQKALADETVSAVVDRTGGVPLFVEELTRALLERADARPTGREIPATLHDSLIARLDRLGPARETLQLGAVLGSDFSYELLYAIHPTHDHDELQRHLRLLTDAELLYVRGLAPDATYQFKHALIRDAAYEALLKSRRKELHRLVAQTIDTQFSTLKENQPEVLAQHWTEAGQIEPAIAAWIRASQAAKSRNAFNEALRHYEAAIELTGELPEAAEHDSQKLGLLAAMTQLLVNAKGLSAPETREAMEQACTLAEKVGNLPQLILHLFWIWLSVMAAGTPQSAAPIADEILVLAERDATPASLGLARLAQARVHLYTGDLLGAEEYFASYSIHLTGDELKPLYGGFAGAWALAGFGAWLLGHVDSARSRVARAIDLGSKSDDPYPLALALYVESRFFGYLKEFGRAEAAAARAAALSKEHGFGQVLQYARLEMGWARAQLGFASEGVSTINQSLAGLDEIGVRTGLADFLTQLAEAQALDGKVDIALSTIEKALVTNPEEVVFRPNALNCRGEIQLKLNHLDLAESDFRGAITLAKSMSAKSLELSATISLARLLRDTIRRDEAYSMLSAIYNWFTEGFDTTDLKEAKALLDELSA